MRRYLLRDGQLWSECDVQREQRGGPVVELLEAEVDRGSLHRERPVHAPGLVDAPGKQTVERQARQ